MIGRGQTGLPNCFIFDYCLRKLFRIYYLQKLVSNPEMSLVED